MNDLHDDDARAADAFDQLRTGVEPTVDIDASLSDLHHTPVVHPARRWAAAAVASVARRHVRR